MDEALSGRGEEAQSGPEEATLDALQALEAIPEGELETEVAGGTGQDEGSAREGEHEAVEIVPDSETEVLDPSPDILVLPAHSVRSEVQGARGCWAVSVTSGGPCGAAAIRGEDYCNAHAGRSGVAADPAKYAPLAAEASRTARATRARMRLELGITRPNTLRGQLRAQAYANAERISARVIDGALDDPKLALRLIEVVDPPIEATISTSMPATVEEVEGLSFSQLLSIAEANGIPIPELPAPPA